MFIRTHDELEKLGRIKSPLVNDTFRSARFLTAADRMGYSYNENWVKKGVDAVILGGAGAKASKKLSSSQHARRARMTPESRMNDPYCSKYESFPPRRRFNGTRVISTRLKDSCCGSSSDSLRHITSTLAPS